ncbi:MAG TPA: hypothetical protein VK864_20355 [Longimicrobiales bacterium]|nr:hypothetical protein [Longimicrobiales bacterium]
MGEWPSGRVAEWASGRVGEWASGRVGEWANGRMGEWANGRMGEWGGLRQGEVADSNQRRTNVNDDEAYARHHVHLTSRDNFMTQNFSSSTLTRHPNQLRVH